MIDIPLLACDEIEAKQLAFLRLGPPVICCWCFLRRMSHYKNIFYKFNDAFIGCFVFDFLSDNDFHPIFVSFVVNEMAFRYFHPFNGARAYMVA